MSSVNTENAGQREESNTQEMISPEPTVPLSAFQLLQARLRQLEITSERKKRSDASDDKGFDNNVNPRRRKNVSDINHEAQCRTWRRWFSAQQSQGQDVRTYYDCLMSVIEDLHGPPGHTERYYKFRTGLLPSIREVLDVQIIQPIDCEELLSLVLRIEKNRKTTSRQDNPSHQPPAQSLIQDRRPNQGGSVSRSQGRSTNISTQKGNRGSDNSTTGGQSGGLSRTSGASRRSRRDCEGHNGSEKEHLESQSIRETKNGQGSLTKRQERQRRMENNLCFDRGKPYPRPTKCSQAENESTTNSVSSEWDIKLRHGRPSNPSDTWTSSDPPQPHIERFKFKKQQSSQNTDTESRGTTQSPQKANVERNEWLPPPNQSADAASLLD